MLQSVVDHDCQRCGHTYTVVGAEGSAVGAHPFAVDDSLYRLVFKIEALVVALAHHIHVSLQNHGGGVLVSGSGGFAHDDVAGVVGHGLYTVLLGEVEQIFTYFLLFLRGAGNPGDLIENPEHHLGLKVFYFHN